MDENEKSMEANIEKSTKMEISCGLSLEAIAVVIHHNSTSYTKRVLWKVLTFSLYLKRLSQGQGVATEGNRGSLFVVANQGPYYGYYLLCILLGC